MAIALVVALVLRFSWLDRSVYWYDETITSVRIAGYTKEQVEDFFVPQGRLVAPSELAPLQRSGDRSWSSTIASLATETPDQVPLYYLLLRAWTMVASDSVGAIRSFSALVSVLVLPALGLLCWEWLADRPERLPATGLAIGLAAVSPIQVVYGREARGYSLAMVLALLAGWALLRAVRLTGETTADRPRSRRAWMVYSAIVALNFYGHLPLALGVAAQGAYLGLRSWLERAAIGWHGLRQRAIAWGWSLLAALLAFSPWIVYWLTYRKPMGWIDRTLEWGTLIQRWGLNFSAIALDWQALFDRPLFDISSATDPVSLTWPWLPIGLLGWAIAACTVDLWRNTPPAVWLFPIAWAATPLPFALLDAIDGGQRSTIARYFLPAYLGLGLILAAGLARALTRPGRRAWVLGAIGLLWVVGLWSSSRSVVAITWWNKYSSYDDPAIAQVVRQLDPPIVVSGNGLRLLTLARQLPDRARLIHIEEPSLPLPPTVQRAIAYRPKSEWLDRLQTDPGYQLSPIAPFADVWRIDRR
ncbi:MAG: hypothetical protein EA001_03070 [Oscillatoriales cyanobacterium]|nr:MAG: hypothetical protein EA001_03070 [Oscillatoriales cyanobacterium]